MKLSSMTLDSYLKQNEIKPLSFAKKIGLKGKATIYRYLRHENIPGPEIMNKIMHETGGQVTPNDFYSAKESA